MDTWLKALIAAACVVVIAGGGYYFNGEYGEVQRRAAEQTRVDEAMSWLYRLSGAKEGDTRRASQFCDNLRKNPEMQQSAKKLGADQACAIAGF